MPEQVCNLYQYNPQKAVLENGNSTSHRLMPAKNRRKRKKNHYPIFKQKLKRQSIMKTTIIPENSIILKNFGKVDYSDTYQALKTKEEAIDLITNEMFKGEKWSDLLMKIRNNIMGLFGLKAGNSNPENVESYYPIGSKVAFFTVIDRNENEIVMAENDKHLNFRVSVMMDKRDGISTVYLSTIVKYNNAWGKLYFFFVKPFHKAIIQSTMKRYER